MILTPAVHWTTGRLTFGQTCVRRGCAGSEGAYVGASFQRINPRRRSHGKHHRRQCGEELRELLQADEELEHGQLVGVPVSPLEELRIVNLGFRTKGPPARLPLTAPVPPPVPVEARPRLWRAGVRGRS